MNLSIGGLLQPRNSLLPLTLLAIIGPGVAFLGPLSGFTARWVIPALLLAYVLTSLGQIQLSFPRVLTLVSYIVWCWMTYGWTLIPDLSLMKLFALVLMVASLFLGGYKWAAERSFDRGLDFLWPFALAALAASLLGSDASSNVGGFVLEAGVTGNPNFLGIILALSTPILVLGLYRNWADTKKRILWAALLFPYIIGMYQSGSRGSYLVFVLILCGLLAGIHTGRLVFYTCIVALGVSVVALVLPSEAIEGIVQRNVIKSQDSDEYVFYTREQPWEDSYEAALEGGVFGVGYGISVGNFSFDTVDGLTASNYGREKGNTQMAIVEETGLIGLFLYAALLAVLFMELVTGFLAARNEHLKRVLGVVIGCLLGLTIQSGFEAWWVAPGAVEFGLFWVMAGAGTALARTAQLATLTNVTSVNAHGFAARA